VVRPDVLIIQETICNRDKVEKILNSWLKGWKLCSIDVEGQSIDLITTCSLQVKMIEKINFPYCIMVHINGKYIDFEVKICNVYGPYINHNVLWENLSNSNIFKDGDVILGGDMKFKLPLKEIWGQHPRQDPLDGYFVRWLENKKLLDLVPKKLYHTWSTCRKGIGLVVKRIDLFLFTKY